MTEAIKNIEEEQVAPNNQPINGQRDPFNYYKVEDSEVVAAVYDARVYSQEFSAAVNEIKVGDLENQRRMMEDFFGVLDKL